MKSGTSTHPHSIADCLSAANYRRLADFPLIAIAGIAEDEAYAEFTRSRNATWLTALLGTLIIVAFIAVLMLQSARLQKSQRLATQAAT